MTRHKLPYVANVGCAELRRELAEDCDIAQLRAANPADVPEVTRCLSRELLRNRGLPTAGFAGQDCTPAAVVYQREPQSVELDFAARHER
jgi:hypothetical protein